MNVKKFVILIAVILTASVFVIFFILSDRKETKIDIVAVNDITQTLAEQWENLGQANLPCTQYGYDYTVIANDNSLIGATREGLNTSLGSAIANRDTVVDIKSNDTVLGKLIIYNDSGDIWYQYKNLLLIFSLSVMAFVAVLSLIYVLYIDKTIFMPFRKLQKFARHIAQGNLDMPLGMDKGNIFGAFTESFDLMREELKKARENERIANQSKKELVASLSHDIKTPVASIKAVSEVMYAKTKDKDEKKQLNIINTKADQINTLITDMFNATLEELQELKVAVTEQPSLILYDLIKNADYNNLTAVSGISECIIIADKLRLAQVIDNILTNSYKYAGTAIDVAADIKDKFLEITFKDYGAGIFEDEKPLIFNKYYRAKNSEGKSGNGLGLYISKYLMNKMSGDIDCNNTGDGFEVRLNLRIA